MTLDDLRTLVIGLFKCNATKADNWFCTKNPLLGGLAPITLYQLRPEKLEKFILTALEENKLPEEKDPS